MKFFKKLLIYLAFILGGLLVIALCIFAFMYFAPNNPVLGLEYVLYSENNTNTYNLKTDPSVSGVKAVEIITEMSDIYIYPNNNSDEIVVKQNQNFSGLVKAINGNLTVDTNLKIKSFEENTNEFKTFSVISDEPSGWVSKKKSYIAIFIPNNLSIDTIYAKSNSGNIYYTSHNEEEAKLQCVNLYLQTSNSGVVDISNKEKIANYYLSTGSGKVKFSEVNLIGADRIKFSTKSGSLTMANVDKNATLTLTEGLYINSNDKRYGPNIIVNKLLGNLYVDAQNGNYEIGQIGDKGVNKTVAMNIKKSKIYFGTVYGQISLLSDTTVSQNDVTINNLIYPDGETSILETGKGNATINTLDAHLAVDSTKGNINIKNASVESDIYTYSTSGNIYISYDYMEDYDNGDTDLKVITETGNINLVNVSCLLEVKVRSSSAKSSLNVTFSNVAYKLNNKNVIDGYNRKIKIKAVGLSDSLQFRIASTKKVDFLSVLTGGEILDSTDGDYLLEFSGYEDYSRCYRIGYSKNDDTYKERNYNTWGVLCIRTTNQTTLETQTKVTK